MSSDIKMEPMQYCSVTGDAWISMTQAHYIFNLPERNLAFRVQMVYKNLMESEDRIPMMTVEYRNLIPKDHSKYTREDDNYFLFTYFSTERSWCPLHESKIPSDLADKIEKIAKAVSDHFKKYEDVFNEDPEAQNEIRMNILKASIELYKLNPEELNDEENEKTKKIIENVEAIIPPRWDEERNDPQNEIITTMQKEVGLEFQNYVKTLNIRL